MDKWEWTAYPISYGIHEEDIDDPYFCNGTVFFACGAIELKWRSVENRTHLFPEAITLQEAASLLRDFDSEIVDCLSHRHPRRDATER
jgi:hypothetical protein